MPDFSKRNWEERAFTIGIGGCVSLRPLTRKYRADRGVGMERSVRPVGTGKTALTLALCRYFRDNYNIGAPPFLVHRLDGLGGLLGIAGDRYHD